MKGSCPRRYGSGASAIISDGKLNAAAMAALQRQRAMTGNDCRLDILTRKYGKVYDALIGCKTQVADEASR
jgi:hypothetical protein